MSVVIYRCDGLLWWLDILFVLVTSLWMCLLTRTILMGQIFVAVEVAAASSAGGTDIKCSGNKATDGTFTEQIRTVVRTMIYSFLLR